MLFFVRWFEFLGSFAGREGVPEMQKDCGYGDDGDGATRGASPETKEPIDALAPALSPATTKHQDVLTNNSL
jgi:hypothetical protein